MKSIFTLLILTLCSIATLGQSGDVKKFANDSEVPRITVAESKKGFDDGNIVFVDARSADIYKEEHIKGALSLPSGSTDFSKLPKGKRIVVYCS